MKNLILTRALASLPAAPAFSQRSGDWFALQVGAFFPTIDLEVRIDGTEGNVGSATDFGSDLGSDRNRTLQAFVAEWGPNDKGVLTTEHFALGRRNDTTSDRHTSADDTTFPMSANPRSDFESDVIRFTVGNRFYQTNVFEIGATVGPNDTDFNVFIDGEGYFNGQTGQIGS